MFGRLGQKLAGAVTGRAAVTTAAAVAGVGLVGGGVAMASSDNIHAPAYPWNHAGPVSAFDTGAIRRGFEVYRNVLDVPQHGFARVPQPGWCVAH